ncbi:MAG: SUMF1/EgtB/PvdO family nonheme iron enzyme [Bdellovibrionia bacterium]
MIILINKSLKLLILLIGLFSLALDSLAAEMVYFRSYDGNHFACEKVNLAYNLDHENGKLAAICSGLALSGDEDGKSEETAFKLDVDGRLFRKYILNFLRYGKVTFKDNIDAENTLTICEDLGLPLAEEYICLRVLDRELRRPRIGLLGSSLAELKVGSEDATEIDKAMGRFVKISGGIFQMGSPTEEPNRSNDETQHEVTLSDFEIGEAAITQETYARIMGKNPSYFKTRKTCPKSYKVIKVPSGKQIEVCADHPVEEVSWDETLKFINAVNSKFKDSGYEFALPTEAQLEYAFRGGTTSSFVSGEEKFGLEEYVWYFVNSENKSHPVRSKRRNDFGIYRSSVLERTQDWFGKYSLDSVTDPTGPLSGTSHITRGGGWYSPLADCRSAARHVDSENKAPDVGFRLVRTFKH